MFVLKTVVVHGSFSIHKHCFTNHELAKIEHEPSFMSPFVPIATESSVLWRVKLNSYVYPSSVWVGTVGRRFQHK